MVLKDSLLIWYSGFETFNKKQWNLSKFLMDILKTDKYIK